MPALIPLIIGTIKSALFSVVVEQMIMKLLKSDAFIKRVVAAGLQKLVDSTETKADDKLLAIAKKEWELDG